MTRAKQTSGAALKVLFSLVTLVFLIVVAICIWFFAYSADLPDYRRLFQFAPRESAVLDDACLSGYISAVPLESIGVPLRQAIEAAEDPNSYPDQTGRSLLCYPVTDAILTEQELRLMWQIRLRFSRDQLFTIYANRAYFGRDLIGLEDASQHYFHKEPSALNFGEAALLAGLVKSPERYSPYLHSEEATQRRNQVLELMAAKGNITQAEAGKWMASPLSVQKETLQRGVNRGY